MHLWVAFDRNKRKEKFPSRQQAGAERGVLQL